MFPHLPLPSKNLMTGCYTAITRKSRERERIRFGKKQEQRRSLNGIRLPSAKYLKPRWAGLRRCALWRSYAPSFARHQLSAKTPSKSLLRKHRIFINQRARLDPQREALFNLARFAQKFGFQLDRPFSLKVEEIVRIWAALNCQKTE